MRRRLGLAIGGEAGICEGCGRQLDAHGHHRAACTRTGRNHARHRSILAAWRQVFQEAGGQVPDRNVERMLRNTHVPVRADDNRRMDLVVPGLAVARGLPLFCDATCVTVISGNGMARSGATTRSGAILARAHDDNATTYPEVEASGMGRLCCLGVEVYGRWSADPLELIGRMARARTEGLPNGVGRTVQAALSRRWWGLLGVSVQRAVAQSVLRTAGADLAGCALEPPPGLADLPVG